MQEVPKTVDVTTKLRFLINACLAAVFFIQIRIHWNIYTFIYFLSIISDVFNLYFFYIYMHVMIYMLTSKMMADVVDLFLSFF